MKAQDIDFTTKVRVVVPHDEGCIGWWWFDDRVAHRSLDSIGRRSRHAMTPWVVAHCNGAAHKRCPAEAVVSLLPMMKRLEGLGVSS